jgi:anti-sigma-K factor RskA
MNEHGLVPRRTGPDDAELVRYLDGELSPIERARVERDIAADTAVASRLAALRQRTAGLQALLAHGDPHMEAPRVLLAHRARAPRAATLLRAAAIVLAVLALGMLVPPVRAWVAASFARIAGSAPPSGEATPLTASPSAAGALRITFAVHGDAFQVAVDYPQAEGTISIRRTAATTDEGAQRGAAEIHGAADADMLVLPGVLRIRNQPGDRASYSVVLPERVTDVTIRIGNREWTVPRGDGPRTYGLSGMD